MSIVIFGGDGYLGWPLSIKLALRHPDSQIVIADNLDRRRLVAEVGGNSITPVASPAERIKAFEAAFGQSNISFTHLDLNSAEVDAFIAKHKPEVVYHLAQQASAPYSMSSVDRALYTINNNEGGNMRLLWAMRRHVPNAHLVKLGSFGEYATCGIDVAEGYYRPTYKGKMAQRPVPYPRASNDIYHITKINDSNFIGMACRKWGMRVTDVMQSTIFGAYTEETAQHPDLYTRLDYDAIFGTVANRFLTQTVAGHPMTVYGTGLQRSGLMALEDSLNSLAAMAGRLPDAGEHRVINHVTERSWCVSEIAETIKSIAADHGYEATIVKGAHDPREETDTQKLAYDIETPYVDGHLKPTPMGQILAKMFEIVDHHKARIDAALFPPGVQW